MLWYIPYKPRIQRVFQTAVSRMGQFPSPLDGLALAYAAKFDPTAEEGGKDYICSLLPYWMQETTGITDKQCETLALANIYGMLYFFIQDDVMDSAKPGQWKGQLALANLLQVEMHAVLRGLFPSDSPFWRYYEQYITTWADCVMNEAEANYFLKDPIRTAGKAGPVKISSTGACLLAGKAHAIPVVEEAVDLVLMTLQMLDDWADWREDLAEGSYNGLLAHIASLAGVPSFASLTEEKVESHIYVLGALNSYAEAALANQQQLTELPQCPPALMDYNSYMTDYITELAAKTESNKRRALGGGFDLLFK
ncbi:hypothetical protein [Paenibacillus sp. PL2-23]|uniref:hypothetical protein n=1 Tax=Paenibacillus sp. PL2-23 TaxID=2100729 RepID=UPI0030F5307A